MKNSIDKICLLIRKIKQEEIDVAQAMINEQASYLHPLKMATAYRQHRLAEHNRQILASLIELKSLIEEGKEI